MRKSLCLLTFVFSLIVWDGARAQTPSRDQIKQKVNDNVVFLMGGLPGATFNELANDIAVVVSDDKLRVLSVEGGAAVQNVKDVLYLRNIDMALTTLEAMNYLKTSGELGSNVEQRLAYIAPLFPNPLQILARGGAKSIRDLNGTRVNFNNKGSATAQFAPNVFKTLGVNVQEFYMPQGDALEKIRRGELDATVCSCPGTVPAFKNVKPDSGLQFVSVPYEKALQATYLPGSIGNDDYPALVAKGRAVDTISASTVLVSYNWPKNTGRYERTAKFIDALFSRVDEFHKPPRSPLWKSVNFAASIPGWTRFQAAEDWLADWRARQAGGEQAGVKQSISGTGFKPSAAQADQLFREFESWEASKH
ncbi:MAG TPA: TAXI family TRAP transporter solute-binding subunit [Xanthobacteraceae bacterium]